MGIGQRQLCYASVPKLPAYDMDMLCIDGHVGRVVNEDQVRIIAYLHDCRWRHEKGVVFMVRDPYLSQGPVSWIK
jgi:hypothetical protein